MKHSRFRWFAIGFFLLGTDVVRTAWGYSTPDATATAIHVVPSLYCHTCLPKHVRPFTGVAGIGVHDVTTMGHLSVMRQNVKMRMDSTKVAGLVAVRRLYTSDSLYHRYVVPRAGLQDTMNGIVTIVVNKHADTASFSYREVYDTTSTLYAQARTRLMRHIASDIPGR